jgi:protein TonB
MRPAVTLYEFMPYGAPELLESRQRLMSQALIVASATALALWALAAALVPRIIGTSPKPAPTIVAPGQFVLPPPLVPSPPPAPLVQRMPVARPTISNAPPVPVPDPVAPPIEPPAASGAEWQILAPPGAIGSGDAGAATGEGPPPRPDEYVYVEELPSVVKEVKPPYPWLAKEAGIEGLVMVKVLVGTDGRVRDALLDTKLQVPMLNEAALAAARQWIFTPGLAGGRPVACWTAIPFRFRLH